jgi:hypothetical protein
MQMRYVMHPKQLLLILLFSFCSFGILIADLGFLSYYLERFMLLIGVQMVRR